MSTKGMQKRVNNAPGRSFRDLGYPRGWVDVGVCFVGRLNSASDGLVDGSFCKRFVKGLHQGVINYRWKDNLSLIFLPPQNRLVANEWHILIWRAILTPSIKQTQCISLFILSDATQLVLIRIIDQMFDLTKLFSLIVFILASSLHLQIVAISLITKKWLISV